MKHKIRLMLAAIAFVFSANLIHAQSLTVIMYVRTTSDARNEFSRQALENTVARLDAGGRQSGEKFMFYAVDTFRQAKDIRDNPNLIPNRPNNLDVNRVAVVAHGIYDQDGRYQGMLEDKTYTEQQGGVDERSVRWEFWQFFACSDKTITNTDIGNKIASERKFDYPAPPPTSGKPSSGIWSPGTSGRGYWAYVTYNGTIGYMGSDGKYYVVGYSTSVYVWVPTEGSPGDEAMT
jgi:hypothetical protein